MIEIIWIDLINITEFIHRWGPDKNNCTLHHTKTFCDWMNHTYQENMEFFETADFILVERQPPVGFVVIEQLIFSRWREKTILVHPRSMHKYFNIGQYDYEQRKIYVEKIARMNMKDQALLDQLGYYNRAHDIADSICIMIYWTRKKSQEYKQKESRRRIMENFRKNNKEVSMEQWFDNYKYIPQL